MLLSARQVLSCCEFSMLRGAIGRGELPDGNSGISSHSSCGRSEKIVI